MEPDITARLIGPHNSTQSNRILYASSMMGTTPFPKISSKVCTLILLIYTVENLRSKIRVLAKSKSKNLVLPTVM